MRSVTGETRMRRCFNAKECTKCGRVIPKGSPNFYYNPRNKWEGVRCYDCSTSTWFNHETSEVETPSEHAEMVVETLAKFDGKCASCGLQTRKDVTKLKLCQDGKTWIHTYCQDKTTEESEEIQEPAYNNILSIEEIAAKLEPSFIHGLKSLVPGNKIQAIKNVRERLHCTLRSALDFVNSLMESPTLPVPQSTQNTDMRKVEVSWKIAEVVESQPVKPEANVKLGPIAQAVWDEISCLVQKTSDTPNLGPELIDLIQMVRDAQARLNEQISKRPTVELVIKDSQNIEVRKVENPHPHTMSVFKISQTFCFGKRLIPYLHGPAGSGKTTIALQVSQAYGLQFHTISLNRQSTPTVILGFVDAHGKYQGTPYSEAWINGGIILIDEFDNASGNLLTTLNTGWANGVQTFPHGQFQMHKDCILICAGNTCGRGADRQYNERQQLDAATLDRITYVHVPYDEKLESNLAASQGSQGQKWASYVQDVRARASKNNVRVVISPRASYRGTALLESGFTWSEVVEMELRKGLDLDTWNKIR